MKTALVIDKKKIKQVKKKIKTEKYMEKAISQLAHQLSFVFN